MTVGVGRIEYRPLNSAEVKRSRERYGSNELVKRAHKGFFRQFVSNFSDPIIKILLIALAVNVILFIREMNWYESAGIAVAILLATLVSTLSEYGSEAAFEKLREDAAKTTCRIRRAEGVEAYPVDQVVVGDLVHLQTGERVPADGIVVQGQLSVDQSSINGESKEAYKYPVESESARDFLSPNTLYRGTVVTQGEGVMLVEKVGGETFYGKLAKEVQDQTRESPLKLRLRMLANTISKFGYVAAVVVALANLFNGIVIDNGFDWVRILAHITDRRLILASLMEAVTLAVTVVVMAVPEGLPMMITVVLSSNMKRMVKDNVLVRKLVGIETSGSLNILFTDKTGTLTKGLLTVKNFYGGDGKEYLSKKELKRIGWLMETVSFLSEKGRSMRVKPNLDSCFQKTF